MKQFAVRGLAALVLVTTLGLTSAAAASAGGIGVTVGSNSGHGSSAEKTYRQELASYKASRAAIEATFRASIASARATYQKTLATATTSAERSAAQQAMEYAIVEAASVRSTALVSLGNPPTDPA